MGKRTFNWAELKPEVKQVWQLSLPAILTQITTIAMQYIDSAMVGALGAAASAAIGLVVAMTWLYNGVLSAVSAGFSVQVAHRSKSGYGSPKCRPARSDQCPDYFRTFVFKRSSAQSSAADRIGWRSCNLPGCNCILFRVLADDPVFTVELPGIVLFTMLR